MHDLQRQKISYYFHLMDRNGDGFLEKSDLEAQAESFCRVFEIASGTPEHRQVYSRQLQPWDQLLAHADTDKDGKISLDEYLAVTAAVLADTAVFQRFVSEASHATLSMSDRDGDGKLSFEEVARQLAVHGISKAEAKEAFGHTDRDGDGFITLAELEENTREFFYSTDPAAPGNWALGPGWQRVGQPG